MNVYPHLLHIISESLPCHVAAVDDNMRYLYANPRWIQTFGLAEDYLGTSHDEVVPTPPVWQTRYQECLQGKTYIGETVESLPLRTGETLFLRQRILPWHTETGAIGGLIFYIDVVDASKVHEIQYQTLLENMAAGVVLHAQDGTIIACNLQACQILGIKKEQLLGRASLDPHWHTIREDGSPFEGKDHPSMQVLRTGKPVRAIIMGVHIPDDNLKWISINADPIFLENEHTPTGAVVSFQDISALKYAFEQIQESESQFRTLFEVAPVAILMINPEGQILNANQSASQMFGYSLRELQHSSLSTLIPMPNRKSHQHFFQSFVANPHTRYMADGMTFEALQKSGEVLPVTIALSYIQTPDNLTLVAFIVDSSERIQAEKARELTHQLIVQLETEKSINRLKSNFLNIVAHDFRTPLSVIMTSTGLLRLKLDHLTAEQVTTRLDRIDLQVKRLLNLLDEVSFINKLHLSQYQVNPAPVQLKDLLLQIAEEAMLARPEKEVRVKLSTAGALENIQLDVFLLDHILENLLSNAVKYSPKGTEIRLICVAEAENLRIQIQDKGIGIPTQDLPYLFQAFHRASNVGDIEGTGLGLTIVKQAVEAHGGEILCESEEGIGSTFTVILPI